MMQLPSRNPPTSYLFIDGSNLNGCLKKISDRYFGGDTIIIDWDKLRGQNSKVFYYDAIPVQQSGEDENTYTQRIGPKVAELNLIERQRSYHVRSGDAIHRKRRGNEQKMVDVQLAVDVLSMASKGLFDRIELITSDLDFKPLLNALVDMGVDVLLYYSPGETNENLLSAPDSAIPITVNNAINFSTNEFSSTHLLPQSVFNFQSNDPVNTTALAQWSETGYGNCRVILEDGKLKLLTQTCPLNPSTHRLEIVFNNAIILRSYAQDIYGLTVPSW